METRTILQIILGSIFLLILGLGGYIIYTFTKKAEVITVTRVLKQTSEEVEEKNPWEDKGAAAIEVVKRQQVVPPPEDPKSGDAKKGDDEQGQETITFAQLLERESFIQQHLKLPKGSKPEWSAQWWGQTEHGPSYFLVRFGAKDANITVGPEWLVNLKGPKIVPKNVLARVVQRPVKGKEDPYYDKHQQVVSALASHRFESELNLGGALLMYFEQRESSSEKDEILGWTIEHDRGPLFKAYFQWIESGDPTYAEFEFDYDKKALKASNLQAANIMRIGEDFEKTDRAKISPDSYDARAKKGKRWKGGARDACRSRKMRSKCRSLATMLQQDKVVEALAWMLTAQVESADSFEACKRARKCSWKSNAIEGTPGAYTVSYVYDLTKEDDEDAKSVSWELNLKDGKIKPIDKLAQASWKAVYPRESDSIELAN